MSHEEIPYTALDPQLLDLFNGDWYLLMPEQ